MARRFNGTSDVISPPTLSGITASLTISLWFNLSGAPGAYPNGYLLFGTGAAGKVNYAVVFDTAVNNALLFQYTVAGSFVTFSIPYTYDTGVWHNAVISTDFTSAGTHMYLDGVAGSVSTSGTPGTPDSTNTWTRIGTVFTAGANQDFYKGLLADVALWNTALSSSAAAQLAAGYRPVDVNSANLQFWMPLSGYSSPEPDISGNANNGTVTGTSQAAMPPSLGRGGRSFNGSSDYIDVAGVGSLLTSNPQSWSLWVNASAPAGTYGTLFAGYNGGNFVSLYVKAAGVLAYYITGGSADPSAASVVLGSWNHIVFTYDGLSSGGTIIVYVNGVAKSTVTATNSIAGTSYTSMWIGDDPGHTTDYYKGQIADFAVWNNIALSSTDVTNLYNGIRPNLVQASKLVGWWPCDGFSNSSETDRSGNSNNGTLNPGSASGPFPILGPPLLWRLSA